MTRRVPIGAAIAVIILLLGARVASAYPHFQLASGTTRCNQCHLAPAGGGLLTEWGRSEAGDTVSGGGNGAFLHGLVELPPWLDVGGDVRIAGLVNHTGSADGAETALFPMQSDVLVRAGTSELSMMASVGLRGQVRARDPDDLTDLANESDGPSALSYVISREHYLYYRPKARGPYGRLGRFYAPYGLRLVDHTAYIRRYLGTDQLQETYGASGGWIAGDWEAHATAFASDPWRGVGRDELGGALLLERHHDQVAYGLSARLGAAEHDMRSSWGLHGKLHLEPAAVLVMAEVDGVYQRFDGGPDRWQFLAYAGPVWNPARGLYLGAAYQLFDADLPVRGVSRQAIGTWLSYLPWAHTEIMLSARGQRIGSRDYAGTALLQLHYYL